MTDIEHVTESDTEATTGSDSMNTKMLWVMMLGCCLAIPIGLIIVGGGVAGGLSGASPWLIGIGVVLAIALLINRRVSDNA